jgi:hypothetical protein
MAYLIHNTKTKTTQYIIENNDELSSYSINHGYSTIEITTEEFNGLQNSSKHEVYINDKLVIVDNPDYSKFKITSKEKLDEYIGELKHKLGYNVLIASESLRVKMSNYKDFLNNFDTSALNYPIPSNFETYLESQGIDYLSPRQL